MQEAPQDSWYYTRDGERIGPVTLAELRGKVVDGTLNPRLDMVWTLGMAEWQPAGEIEGLFEKRSLPPPQIALAPPAGTYVPPQLESVAARMGRETDWPGARRRSFLIATLVFCPIVWPFVVTQSTDFLTRQFGSRIMEVVTIGAGFVPLLVAIYFGLRRLVNLGMSRWWWFANFVPFLNLWLGYRCFACPAGYAYHKKLDGAGIFLAIVYWLLAVIGFLALAVMAALFCGALGTPEMQEQLREAYRKVIESSSPR